MPIMKTALAAAALIAVIATANAATRAELESGYHGNTTIQTRSR